MCDAATNMKNWFSVMFMVWKLQFNNSSIFFWIILILFTRVTLSRWLNSSIPAINCWQLNFWHFFLFLCFACIDLYVVIWCCTAILWADWICWQSRWRFISLLYTVVIQNWSQIFSAAVRYNFTVLESIWIVSHRKLTSYLIRTFSCRLIIAWGFGWKSFLSQTLLRLPLLISSSSAVQTPQFTLRSTSLLIFETLNRNFHPIAPNAFETM